MTSFFAKDGSLTRFRYLASLEAEDAACVTYLAEIPNGTGATGDPVKAVVKFVARYGKEVHELLEREGYAPPRYYGHLPDTKLSGIFPRPTQHTPSGLYLRSDLMHMVVMDYINVQADRAPDAREQVEAVLMMLHSEGYAFGDLQEQNILFGAHGKAKLIDFDWCGRYDVNIRDKQLPTFGSYISCPGT